MHALNIFLGLSWNTQDLMVGITSEFRTEVAHLLKTNWHDGRESFDIKELEVLVGKLGQCRQGFGPTFHMMPSVYASGAFILRGNNDFFYSTHNGYRKLIKKAKCKPKHEEDKRDICFAIGHCTPLSM